MDTWMINGAMVLFAVLVSTGLFFFVVTRGALLMRGLSSGPLSEKAHVYPIYSNMGLIKMVDFQPIISAILLFQYPHLVSKIVSELNQMDLRNKKILITSCAFGNVIPRVVNAAVQRGVERVLIADIIPNELAHAKTKLRSFAEKVEFIEDNAVSMKRVDGDVAANVIFFLLHELPHHLKGQALNEAGRMLAPGGKLFLAEFHRPELPILRLLSWTYFKVFEPLGLALWSTHDPLNYLEQTGGWKCERTTYFFGNFQIITATKL
ncbi:class I SAM-dependent methyltransferase [Herbaspirillum sp. ST 5-3]|jgi:ubiquinone/menaquinone biosynthesis C-methylase UbiE|uniref:class I SAM-dependent methyltransferase n=2 Tax=Burkholderiales TaxID=80840 RepID=UPI0010A34978|nr:class I SAM-dependent methyltransferase [Herbaspirillum sp. ST 5-3]